MQHALVKSKFGPESSRKMVSGSNVFIPKSLKQLDISYPIGSMYGISPYIWLICMLHVGKYTIHGSYGYVVSNVLRFFFFGGGERLFFSVSKSDSLKHSMLRNRLPLSPLRALRIGDFHPTCPHLQNAHNGISHWAFLADKTTCLAHLVSHLENKPSTRGLFGKYSQSFSKHVVKFVEGPRRKQLRTICLFLLADVFQHKT